MVPSDALPQPHAFLRPVRLAAVAGPSTPLLDDVLAGFERAATAHGHGWADRPDDATDAFVTTARLHEPLPWRRSPLFVGRRRFGLTHKPANYTFVQVRPAELADLLQRLEAALGKERPSPEDFGFPGLSPNAWQVLVDQGLRGGAMMSLCRLLQAQVKSLRVVMVVGDDHPLSAHLFDLAGAFPRLDAHDLDRFYDELTLRIATHLSTREMTSHRADGTPVPRDLWRRSAAPAAMLRVSRELGARRFFTSMVRIADLVNVPAMPDAIALQYSEGCFGTYAPEFGAQVVTATGSRNPVEKAHLAEDDLAVVQDVLDDFGGVRARPVEGLRNDLPSSESAEFALIDRELPRIRLHADFGVEAEVPVVRSKLHGHRGVVSYDPGSVEHAALDEPFFHYLVGCSTAAQAHGVAAAFARSAALRDPGDPREVVFTVVPGHGLLMVEKWVRGTQPFEVLLRAMDEGRLELGDGVPQSAMSYREEGGRMVLHLGAGAVRRRDGERPARIRDLGDYDVGAG